MAIRTATITAAFVPVALTTGTDSDFAPQSRDVVVQNLGSTAARLGGADVTSSTGLRLTASAVVSLDGLRSSDVPYVIAETEAVQVVVLEAGV